MIQTTTTVAVLFLLPIILPPWYIKKQTKDDAIIHDENTDVDVEVVIENIIHPPLHHWRWTLPMLLIPWELITMMFIMMLLIGYQQLYLPIQIIYIQRTIHHHHLNNDDPKQLLIEPQQKRDHHIIKTTTNNDESNNHRSDDNEITGGHSPF